MCFKKFETKTSLFFCDEFFLFHLVFVKLNIKQKFKI